MSVRAADPTPGNILLDAGTNELEALVFELDGGWYGVNVAKVREVVQLSPTTKSPGRHRSVIGAFNIRGQVVPLVDLKGHLGLTGPAEGDPAEGRVIITEFNDQRIGFHVDSVDRIHRISWKDVRPAPTFRDGRAGVVTGVLEINEHLILMIDFESVADSIALQEALHCPPVENTLGVDRGAAHVILAEDSPFMRERMREVFLESGYTKIEVFGDGERAWDRIRRDPERVDAVVSDIEMPRMDGLALTKQIKSDPALSGIPVLLFSSLISADNKKKGEQVGATIQIPKPQLPELILLVDRLIAGMPLEGAATERKAA
jgi:two-component system chemotaxis response regulator CheV